MADLLLEYIVFEDVCVISTCESIPDNGIVEIPSEYEGVPVVAINHEAFRNQSGMLEVTIPETIVSIGNNAFEGCEGLRKVRMSDNVTNIGSSAFSGCTFLNDIVLPEGLTELSDYIFQGCSSLVTIAIPENVVTINDYAFYLDASLETITIPESVTTIGDCAFLGCTLLKEVKLPEEMDSIGELAFSDCSSLVELKMPKIATIGDNAFLGCEALEKIYISDIHSWLNTNFSNREAHPNYYGNLILMEGEEEVFELVIPETVTSIPNYSFYNCVNIESISFPSSITSIGEYAFYNCPGLKEIEAYDGTVYRSENNCLIKIDSNTLVLGCDSSLIPEDIQVIDKCAFNNRVNITSVKLPNGITEIKDEAFKGCVSLQTIEMGNSILTFGSNIFEGCLALKDAYYTGSKQVWDSYKAKINNSYFSNLIVHNDIMDFDFMAFTYDGYHSLLDLNIIRVNSGNRFDQDLTPQMKDVAAEVPNGDGQYYFGTNYPARPFNINFAFDSLTEKQIRQLKTVFSGQGIHDLIFDEEPYKVWSAKVTGVPQLKYIPFDNKDGQRIYKGEGTVQFTCYWPFAHTPNTDTKISKKFRASGTFEKNGLNLYEYDEWLYPTKAQWAAASGLLSSGATKIGENLGDIPSHFIVQKNSTVNAGVAITVGTLSITPTNNAYKLKWDSKTGIVSGTDAAGDETKRKPIAFTGNSLGTIPVGSGVTLLNVFSTELKYNYWYY